jgi:hypothetical protein
MSCGVGVDVGMDAQQTELLCNALLTGYHPRACAAKQPRPLFEGGTVGSKLEVQVECLSGV